MLYHTEWNNVDVDVVERVGKAEKALASLEQIRAHVDGAKHRIETFLVQCSLVRLGLQELVRVHHSAAALDLELVNARVAVE